MKISINQINTNYTYKNTTKRSVNFEDYLKSNEIKEQKQSKLENKLKEINNNF